MHQLQAVNDVSFEINRGETFGLVGESGCGKTTVGRTILRLYKPTGGRVIYNEADITAVDEKAFAPYRRRMQMIFQDPYTSLDPRQPVSEIVGTPLTLHKLVANQSERNDRVRELIHWSASRMIILIAILTSSPAVSARELELRALWP